MDEWVGMYSKPAVTRHELFKLSLIPSWAKRDHCIQSKSTPKHNLLFFCKANPTPNPWGIVSLD